MQGKVSTYKTSDCQHGNQFVPEDNGIGQLFRDHSEQYINVFNPPYQHIKLIRSIRMCKTPQLGGKEYTCKHCGVKKYVFFSCGNSQCPKCQGIKRLQWQDKLGAKMLKTPYQHITFTMPHRLNRLAKDNPKEVYNILLRAAWETLKICCKDPSNVGALPGAIMVLHTFGSDLKYHVHVHALVTFGGINENMEWVWPKRKNKIIPFREIRKTFRRIFLKKIKSDYQSFIRIEAFEDLKDDLTKKEWCVHQNPPTTETKVIEEYLGRYICRIGLSKNKFH